MLFFLLLLLLPIKAHFSRLTWVSISPVASSSSTCSRREPLGLVDQIFSGPVTFLPVDHEFHNTERTQSTNLNQWPCLNFSSFTTGFLMEGVLLPIHWLPEL